MPDRCVPIARLRLYGAGATGYSTDPGWAWYSPMCSDFSAWYDDYGYPYGSTAGTPSIFAFQTLTLGKHSLTIPTPLPYDWDTESSQWTQDSGTWEERVAFAGEKAVTVLWCLDNAGQITSDFYHPEGPAFCVHFQPMSTPDSWEIEDDPPYLSVYWGDPSPAGYSVGYELRLYWDGSLYCGEHAAGGVYTHLGSANIGWQWPIKGRESQPIGLMILHLAGGIAVRPYGVGSSEWLFFENPNADIWPEEGGQFVIDYRGGQAIFGFHGVVGPVPSVGSTSTVNEFHSEVRTTDRTRAGTPTVEGWYTVPTVDSPTVAPALSVANVSHAGTDEVEMKATVTWGYKAAEDGVGAPISAQTGRPLSYRFPYFPEFYAGHIYFAPSVQAPAGSPAEIYSEELDEIVVELPEEAQVASANVSATWDISDSGDFSDYLFMRTVDLAIGWLYDDDSELLTEVITGVVVETTSRQLGPDRLRIQFRVCDTSLPLRGVECDDSWPVMDGWNGQTAALHVAAKLGWHSSLCNFASLSAYSLSTGSPEVPRWQARSGQTVWSFLERICRYLGNELAVAAGGGIASRTMCYFDTLTVHNLANTDCLRGHEPQMERRNAFQYTGVEVHGLTVDDEPLVAVQADTDAENNPSYAFFCGFKRHEIIEEAGCTLQADANSLASVLYGNMRYRLADVISWRTIAAETTLRRDVAYISDIYIGVGNTDRLGIVALRHHWGPRRPNCYTDWEAIPYAV